MKVLGIDISTSSIGFCQMDLFGLIAFSVKLDTYKSHKYRREIIRDNLKMFSPDVIVVESIRLFNQNFINIDAIKRLGGITYLIIDNFPSVVYSVDTRSWKKIILGSSKVEKDESVVYIEGKYGIIGINNDCADAICLAEIGLRINEFPNKFKEVE